MSLEQVVTKLLNVKENDLQEVIALEKTGEDLDVKVKLKPKPTVCPLCGGTVKIHGYFSRKLTHSTFANRNCTLFFQQRRYRCDSCEKTFHEPNPFINSRENLTFETKVNVLKDLKSPEATYTSIARRYNLSVTKTMRLFDAHVRIPRKPLPKILSMDEHYFPESDYDSTYCCLLMNFQSGEMVDVLPDRRKTCLMRYFSSIKKNTYDYATKQSELNNVKYVSIDMYDPFREIASLYFPKALICADSFHVVKHLTGCFRDVRLHCRRKTEDKNLQYLLTKFKYVLHHNIPLDNEPRYNKRFGRFLNYRDLRDMMFSSFPELRVAYELKEYYIRLNRTCTLAEAPKAIDTAIRLFADSGIAEYEPFYEMLTNWRNEVVNSFTLVDGVRINNSLMESKNRILEKLFYNGNGFRNFTRTRNRILYCLNRNDTYKI
ncbi:MAG: ISL3 family transposase [Acidaminococcaceae bacterium]|nr:ISL3 family transposase [Acidaminococcaceae bacterium]